MKIKNVKEELKFKKILFNNKGQSTLEFVLMIPFLIFACFAVFQIGYVIYMQNNIAALSREAARTLTTTNSNALCEKLVEANNNLFKDLHFNVYISPNPKTERKVGDIVNVGIKINYEGFGGLLKSILGKPITIHSESSMRMECE